MRIDGEVADLINRRKDEFFDKYYYLKPECEKEWLEKAGDWLVAAGEWCKEHWKLIVTVLIVIVAVVLICTGIGGIIAAMAWGAIYGAVAGGAIGGAMSMLGGGSFWEGAESGAFMGAIGGIIAGGLGSAMAVGGGISGLSVGQVMYIGGMVGAGSSLFSDLGDILIKGEDISFGQTLVNMVKSAALGAMLAGIGYQLSKLYSEWRLSKPRVAEGGSQAVEVNGKIVTKDNSTFDPNLIDKQGRTNIQRMKQGLSPIGTDGKSVNIHHIDQTNNGPVMEITASEHQMNYSILHTNTAQTPSQIDRNAFNSWRNEYWKWRSDNLN